MRILLPLCMRMICISSYLKDYYSSPKKTIALVPSEIDKTEKKWDGVIYHKQNKVFTFVYAGNPGKDYFKERLDWVIESVYELNKQNLFCRLIIIGVDKDYSGFRRIDNDRMKSVLVLGKLKHHKLLKKVSEADCFIIPREARKINLAGFPTKLAESWGCGVPVVATPTSDIGYYIRKNPIYGFVCRDCSEQALFDEMKNAVNHPVSLDDRYTIQHDNPLHYSNFTEEIANLMC